MTILVGLIGISLAMSGDRGQNRSKVENILRDFQTDVLKLIPADDPKSFRTLIPHPTAAEEVSDALANVRNLISLLNGDKKATKRVYDLSKRHWSPRVLLLSLFFPQRSW